MEVRVLGPLEVIDDQARSLRLGGRKQRALLARLALDANRTVAVERLVDDMWGEDVPESAAKMVQIYVSQLRKVLPAGVLRTRAPGYVIELEPEAVDANRIALLRGEARAALAAGDAAKASERLGDALALWRGPALAEFAEPFAAAEAAHLEELRLACLEERIEADLARGLGADVIGELEALVARHPLRETLHRQLTLALYRSGRQAEALAAYERFREQLDDELGIEPSAAMKALQYGILNQDPQLELPAPRAAPRMPAAGRDRFVARADELRRLEAALDAAAAGGGTTVLIAGSAGIGKTRLAAEVVTRARTRGATVLAGRCIQMVGSGLPYLPFVDALRPFRDSPALGAGLRELPRLIPDLGDGAAVATVAATRADARLALFEDMLILLGRLAATEPLLLVLEDLQWADESTLDLFAFLSQAIAPHRILLVGTYRSDGVRPGDHLYALATGLATAGAARSLTLGPLKPREVEAMLAASSDTPLPPRSPWRSPSAPRGTRSSRASCSPPPCAARRRCHRSCATLCSATSHVWGRTPTRCCGSRLQRAATSRTGCSPRCCRSASSSSRLRCGRRSRTTSWCRSRALSGSAMP